MSKKRFVTLVAVMTFVLISAPAFGQSASDVAVTGMAAANCSGGEAIALGGNLHFTYSASSDQSTGINTYQVAVSSNSSGAGQASQSAYAGSASFSYAFSTTDSPSQLTPTLRYRLNSQGSAPSVVLNLPLAITIDNAGNFVATVGSASTDCGQ